MTFARSRSQRPIYYMKRSPIFVFRQVTPCMHTPSGCAIKKRNWVLKTTTVIIPIAVDCRLYHLSSISLVSALLCTNVWFIRFHVIGHIRWDDEDSNNANKKRGVLPQGRYDDNTRIEFCCRNDPVLSEVLACHTSIQAFQDPNVSCFKNFPKCSEFLLMRYKGTCPPNSPGYRGPHTGFLQWDTEDNNNGDGRVGVFPDGARNFWSGIKIEFCSYTSSSHNYCWTFGN
jgi:hypothetical protein